MTDSLRSITRAAAPLPIALLLFIPASARAEAQWDVERGEVRVVCPLTVGGSFEAHTREVKGRLSLARSHPTTLEGGLAVELRTLETGISLRDEHLREKYLEISRGEGYDKAALSNLVVGETDPDTFQGRTPFTATLDLHGVSKTISGQAEVRRTGPSVRVEASFTLSLSQFGIPEPRYLGVGVKEDVQVKVLLTLKAVGEGK
jgi:polyisoprenoid-binding protein YceI